MFEYILRVIRQILAQPQQEELLIPVRVEEKRPVHKRR